MNKDLFIKLHTTKMGINRIKKNLNLKDEDVVEYCKNKMLDNKCKYFKKGKNYYFEIDNIIITVNAPSYIIITSKKYK